MRYLANLRRAFLCLALTGALALAGSPAVSAAPSKDKVATGKPMTRLQVDPSKGDPLDQFEQWREHNHTTLNAPPGIIRAHEEWKKHHPASGGGTAAGTTALQNGVPVNNLSGAQGDQLFFSLDVPAGAANLSFQMSGGTGDADLYVKFGSQPTLSSYDCRPYQYGNNETCNISNIQTGTYYVMINGYSSFSGVSLVGSFDTPTVLQNGTPVDNLSGNAGDKLYFQMDVPSGASNLSFAMSGGSGDADLYVKFGSVPTTSSYDCRPYINGNNETCNISTIQTGTYYVMINGYSSFSGVSLVGSYDTSGGGGGGGGGGGNATIGTNADLGSQLSSYQGEVTIAADPNNGQHLAAGANTFYADATSACQAPSGNTYGTQALYFSTDGGSTWTYNCAPWPSSIGSGSYSSHFGSDPTAAFDSNGNAYMAYMLISSNSSSNTSAIVVARTTDNGASWQPWGTVVNNLTNSSVFDDKEMMAIDTTSGQAHSHSNRVYVIWDENNVERVAYTDDGSSWTTNVVESGGYSNDIGGDLAIGPDGTVYAIWNRSGSTSESTVFAKSTDGGSTWTSPSVLTSHRLLSFGSNNTPPAQDQRGINAFGSIAVDTDASSSYYGNLYVAYTDFPSGTSSGTNLNVYVQRSTDGGSTWSSAQKVNDDSGSATQFFPWIATDPTSGKVVVSWYDTRNDANNRKTQIYMAYSTDGGSTFSGNQKVTQASSEFTNSTVDYMDENSTDNPNYNANQYGDYAQITIVNGVAHPIWTDSRNFYPSNGSNAAKEDAASAPATLP
ncbi:MAG: pre-peptidase C-terminal domain-containing protein [Gammaproteobacteria bacterium]|jgi:hypothetical protein